MTNVPENIREAWADVYRLFDVSYNMDGSTEAWIRFWDVGNKLIQKYGNDIPVMELLEGTAHALEDITKRRNKNETLTWDKDEDYPHPQ